MSSILDQTLLAPSSSYFFFRQAVSQPISSFAEGGWEENDSITYIVPKRVEDNDGNLITPEYTSEGVIDVNAMRTYALNNQLETELRELFDKILDIDLATASNDEDVDELIGDLYTNVVRKTDMIEFSEEISDEVNLEQQKQQFQYEKNKLFTLMMKNRSIKKKLDYSNLVKTVLTFVLVLYTLILSMIYLHGSSNIFNNIADKIVSKEYTYLVLIGISLFVTLIYVLIDIYQLIKNKKVLEEFEELQNPTRTDLVTALLVYLEKLPMVAELREQLREKVSDKRALAITAILNDFSNMNFINMRRYQLTDYKLNKSKQTINYAIKYAFLLISSIGLVAGFKLRSDAMIANNNASGLLISSGMFMMYTLVAILSYVLVIIGINRQNKLRRQYNWNKLYWNTESTSKKYQN